MKNFVAPGNNINVTLQADLLADGGPYVIGGTLVAIPFTTGKTGETVAMALTGAFEVPKASAEAITQGAVMYWDATNGVATATAGANVKMGHAFKPAAAGATTVVVRLLAYGS